MKGVVGLMLADSFAIRDALTELYYNVIDGFVQEELGKRESELANFSHITVRFEDIEVE